MGNDQIKDYYVILTGAKNNAGDYLIKYRAKHLFSALRSDRKIIDMDGWNALSDSDLKTVNQAKALILMGGPALQNKMYPGIYPLRENLDDIKVPIVTMAIGWKSRSGTATATENYPLSEQTLKLLKRVDDSGYFSSVRDYHTQDTLKHHGFNQFEMTGCSALYSLDHIGVSPDRKRDIKKVSFSLGVNFFKNEKLEQINKNLILNLHSVFPQAEFKVVFHHSTDPDFYRQTHNPNINLVKAQLDLIDWLNAHNIEHVDISGSADSLIDHYYSCDLHVGYRVHAHIFMSSINQRSILIAEDGRGTALEKVLGGFVLNDCPRYPKGAFEKVSAKIGLFNANSKISSTLPLLIPETISKSEDLDQGLLDTRARIDNLFPVMKRWLEQLP